MTMMIKYKYKLLLNILINILIYSSTFITIVQSQVTSTSQWTSGNNHVYQYFSTTRPYSSAINVCTVLRYNGLPGYLATITTKEEEDFILDSLQLRNVSIYISSEKTSADGNWKFATGAEKGALIYSGNYDKCGYYCNLPDNFKAGLNDPQALFLYYDGIEQKWRTGTISQEYTFVCEFGGSSDVVVHAMPAIGGRATLLNYNTASQFILEDTIVSLEQIDTKTWQPLKDRSIKYCTDVRNDGGASGYSCLMPSGTGKYRLNVTDGISTTSSFYQYWNPTVLVSRPPVTFTQGSVITISGTDFGFNASDIQVWLGPSGQQSQCTSIAFINNNAINCTIQQPIQQSFLPINLTINTIEIISFRSSVYYNNNNYSYSCFDVGSLFGDQGTIGNGKILEGMVSTMGVVKDQGQADFLKSVCYGNLQPYLNVLYNSQTNIVYAFGPKAGQSTQLYKSNTIPTSIPSTNRIYYSIRNQVVDYEPPTSPRPILIESWWDDTKPQVSGNYNFQGLSTLQNITIAVKNPGIVTSNVSLVFNGQSFRAYYIDYFTQLAYFTLDYIGGVYNAKIQIDSKPTTDASTISINFSPPQLVHITSPTTTGDGFTIYGKNFGSFLNQITYTIDNTLSCTQPQFIQAHQSIVCKAPAGYGSQLHSLRLVTGGKPSQWLPFTYQIPTISSISSLGVSGGNFTISGTNFFNDPSIVNVMVGPYPCTNITFITDHTQLVCLLAPGFGTHKVIVSIGDQTNDTPTWFTFIKPIVSSATSLKFRQPGYVTVRGDNFEDANIQVFFGGLNGFFPSVNASFIDKNTIIAYYNSDVLPGIRSSLFVNVSINQAVGGAEVYLYEYSRDCPNGCSEQGICVDAHCICNPGYILGDCSQLGNASQETTTFETGQPSNILFDMSYNEPTVTFLSSIWRIQEFDPITNNTLNNYTLSNNRQDWIKLNNINNNNNNNSSETWSTIIFPLTNTSVVIDLIFNGDDIGDSQYFYGEEFEILNRSVSYLVTVNNWKFESPNNLLEIIFATVTNLETETDCDSTQPTVMESNFNEYQIKTRHSALHCVFTNRLVNEKRVQYTQTLDPTIQRPSLLEQAKESYEIDQSTQIIYLYSVLLPSFDSFTIVENQYQASAIIDQDSVECPKSKKWVIPVAVVCSIVGAALIGIAIWLTIRKLKQMEAEKKEGIRLANLYR
ncbi:IPT/TIG domain-containing protein [Cavenderia fasciculata]|uniref:IPT/TIG domain-containing protein n=1 Tax=Cavenderia fasciculata TaxID=261658 RepID=F4PQY5_CACFS|nr:IPT/TIG domain-containing protein [Cavenderia fasciculata]EGG21250.1 IPT/TIG domain-containing protein [Cavenderia fasciculata]|eukprot:XP_004359100.1 IPT/TIG domain-containing protein [Cavenderia fasciculata]